MGPVAHARQVLPRGNGKTWEGWNENAPKSNVSSPPSACHPAEVKAFGTNTGVWDLQGPSYD